MLDIKRIFSYIQVHIQALSKTYHRMSYEKSQVLMKWHVEWENFIAFFGDGTLKGIIRSEVLFGWH